MKVFIKTYGCQANINDSEILAGKLVEEGNTLVYDESEADKIIVNTCSVKNKTQSKIFHYINSQISNNKNKSIEIGVCLTKTLDINKKFLKVKIIDTINTNKLNKLIVRFEKDIAIIQISQGCLNACTFCATKLARGNLKSYRIGDIKRQLQDSVSQGAKKIYLTSQDNGCYGFDIKTNLPELLNELTSVEGDFIIRVGMMNPWHLRKIKNSLIQAYKNPKIQKFIHIPVQSGSERVLKDMKRIHSAEEFKLIVKEFRKEIPDIDIATDIIVGYPTETEEDFQETLNLLQETKPEVVNRSAFSSRPNTKAAKLKQIPSEIVKGRTKILDEFYWSYRRKISL